MNLLPDPLDVLGVGVHPVTTSQLVQTLVSWTSETRPRRAYHVNAHSLNLAQEDPVFRNSLNSADLVYCDGYGAKWAASMLGNPLPERMTPPDWIDSYLDLLDPGTRLFLLGDRTSVVSRCAEAIARRHGHLLVAGAHHGFFDSTTTENEEVVDRIRRSNPHVLLVGMGMPRQEKWIESNMDATQASLSIAVGALFQYYVGAKRRAPKWMTDRGLEWLGRLVVDPRYTYRRYLRGNPRLVATVLRARLAR